MRAFILAAVLALPVSALAAESINRYFDRELAVKLSLSSGVTLTLRTVELVGEDLGRRLILKAEMDQPRPPSADPAALAIEAAEAREICRTYLPQIASYLGTPPERRITHLEVLYRDTKTHYRMDIHSLRALRVDTRRHGCPGA